MVTDCDGIHYAGYWRRFLAFVIDVMFFAALSYGLMYLLYGQAYFEWLKDSAGMLETYATWDGVINNFLPVAITVVCWVKLMGTPGKLLFGCQVVDAETRNSITWGQALLRYIGYFVSLLPLGLGFFWIAVDKRKQGFHDKIAKTVVIREDEFRDLYKELDRGWPEK